MAASAIVRTYRVKPGREQEFNTALAEQRKLLESTGATTRVWATLFAGEAAGRVITVAEYENHAALGAALDDMVAQMPLPIQRALTGDNPAAEAVSISTLIEIT